MEKVFELNPYERFVSDKMVNDKQCTLVWYVEYKKVSHMEIEEVEDLINNFKNYFGELVVTRRK